jgi:hypothetical protein
MYARTYISTLGRAGSARPFRRGLRGLGDVTSDLAIITKVVGAGYNALVADPAALQNWDGTWINTQWGLEPQLNGYPTTDVNTISGQYWLGQGKVLLMDRAGNVAARQGNNFVLLSGSTFQPIAPPMSQIGSSTPATAPAGQATTATTAVSPTSSAATTTTAAAAAQTPAATPAATNWLSSLTSGSITLPIVGAVPTLYVLGGAAAAIALLVFSEESGHHHGRGRGRRG